MEENKKSKREKLLEMIEDDFEISRGSPLPLGATLKREGINFSVFSQNTASVTLVLYSPGEDEPIIEFPLNPRYNITGDIWHAFIRGINPGIEYGYRVDGPSNAEERIHRFDCAKVLIDPYSKALTGGEVWGAAPESAENISGETRAKPRRSMVAPDDFDWGLDQPLNTPLSESIIYELHVRGFTRHKSSAVDHPGTFAGLVEKIPYFKELGVTAIELLPVNEFEENDTDRKNPLTGEKLVNFWGYHPLSFFAPKASYAWNNKTGAQVNEFKTMVKAMHKAGIEVILDVVFNHTAEGDERGTTSSFRGLDNSIYYMIDPQTGEYHNFSGCGNTLNCNHPVVRDMILDSLRYWVTEMHVDGFRFDLASILGRGRDGSVLSNPPLIERIAADPVLGTTKLIAEAWDAAGLYQVGTFPAWGRWAEWNGKFRDDVRVFMKSDPGMATTLARRLTGSPDIYKGSGREPYHSINFITSHDGFTLADPVSYDRKHNKANGEEERDGADDNCSWNCGFEGIEGAPEEVNILRRRQMKNFAAILVLSRGVPMILAGDEFGKTQLGNNNAYCQDNEISWINWELAETNADLLRFFKLLITFRQDHPAIRHDSFIDREGKTEFPVLWHGVKPCEPDWEPDSRSLAMQVVEDLPEDTTKGMDIYLAVNAFWEPLKFELPKLTIGEKWFGKLDTTLESPHDIAEEGNEPLVTDQSHYMVGPRSVVVLLGK